MQKKNIKVFMIPFISLGIFLILVFGAAYAYIAGNISMNTSNYQVTLPSQTSLVCTKTDCNVTLTPAQMANGNSSPSDPKATSTCYLNCTCSGAAGAKCNYNLSLLSTGTPYTPSTSLGSANEFTVQISQPTGCTAQNASSTAKQVNMLSDKVVSSCSLTVPAGGSVSANVSATFKWYNLDILQDIHFNKSYKYYLTNRYELPDEYQQVEYIIFGGPNTYFDTGFVPNQDTTIDVDIETYSTIDTDFWYGARETATTTASTLAIYYLRINGDGERFAYGTTNLYLSKVTTLPLRRHIYQTKNKLYIDGVLKNTWTYSNWTAPCSMAIGNVFSTSNKTPFNNGANGKAKIYYFKIWNGDTLERFYIPCYNKNTNVVGMYDIVNNVFKPNASSGTLVAGPDVT